MDDVLDAGAVIPAAVEEHDLLRGRQLGGKALEVPLALLAVAGLAGRHDAYLARTEVLDDAFDGAVLAGAVPALEDHEHLVAAGDHVAVQLYQLDLQAPQLARILLVAESRCAFAAVRGLFRHV